MRLINLGSGQKPFEKPWVNIDINPHWNPDIVADGAHLPMFEDNSVDVIVSQHCIEHVGLGEFDATIRESHRILRPGGSLIITTPDLYELCQAWMNGKINDYIFCVNLYGAYMGHPADNHRWLYTGKTLAHALRSAAPWNVIAPYDWEPMEGASVSRDWWILGVRAIK